jgi:hypothetical protein
MFHAAKSPIMNSKNNPITRLGTLLTGSWKVNYIGFGSYRDEWIPRTEMKFKVRKQETRSRRTVTKYEDTPSLGSNGAPPPPSPLRTDSNYSDVLV